MLEVKTKEQLQEEIKTNLAVIDDLKAQVKRLEKYQKYDEMADEVFAVKESFVRAGFTEEQAFQLVKCSVEQASRPRLF